MNRRVAVVLAVTLVAACLVGVATWRLWPKNCLDEVVAGDQISAPFRTEEADGRLAELVRAADGWGIGETVASVGYDYDRYIDFAALPGMFAVWRKGDPVMAAVSASTGEPLWGIRQGEVRHTWDASAERFVMLAAPKGEPIEVSAHSMTSGERTWCVRLDQPSVGANDPISTRVDTANNVLVLAGKVGQEHLTSLAASDGHVRWSQEVTGIDHGDYISGEWNGVTVIGGRPDHELGEPASDNSDVLAGIDESGEVLWRHQVEDGVTASVAGASDGQVVVRELGPTGHRLLMFDQESGEEQWQRPDIAPNADIIVRGGVVLMRTEENLSALDIGTGKELWTNPARQQPQQFPYGFRLAEQPMLDADHLLLGATDGLQRLDLRTGRSQRWALPTDGINTTWWPYRVALSGSTVAVATNTGAVLVGGD